jgi:hypothetical protein
LVNDVAVPDAGGVAEVFNAYSYPLAPNGDGFQLMEAVPLVLLVTTTGMDGLGQASSVLKAVVDQNKE